MPTLSRRWWLALAVLGALLLAFAVCEAVGWPFLRGPLASQLSTRLQRDVSLDGRFRLHLLGSIRLAVEELRIAGPDWESGAEGQPFVSARDASLSLPYGTVFGQLRGNGVLRINRLEVGSIEARLVRDAGGRANWQFEFQKEENKPEPGQPSVTPEFTQLIVHSGRLSLRDALAALSIDADARTEEGTTAGSHGLQVRATGSYRKQPFRAEARSPGILPLVAPRGRTEPVALTLDVRVPDPRGKDGHLHVEGTAKDLLRFEGLQGRFTASGASLASVGDLFDVTLPTTAAFKMHGKAARNGTRWDVDVDGFEVARTRLSGQFRYDTAPKVPLLSGKLRGSQLVLEDLAPAFGASSQEASSATDAPDKTGTRRVLPQREFDIPSLHRMDADVDVRLARVDLGSEKLKPLEPLEGRLRLDGGVLKLDKLQARTADGELHGDLTLDARPEMPQWTFDLGWSGIRLQQWITLRNPFARESEKVPAGEAGKGKDGQKVNPPFIRGNLAGHVKLKGQGRSTARMLASLDGSVQMWVRDGAVSQLLVEAAGLDVAQGLGLIIRGDKDIPLECAAISLKGKDGVLATEAGIVDTPDSLILLNGRVSLAEERFDLTLEARPRDRSPLTARSPIHVRGRFADPRIRPDIEKVGGKAALAAALGALLAPLAALLPLTDPGESTAGLGCHATLERLKKNPATPPALKRALKDAKT
ncbi:MAG: hypothetical protein K0R03_706 [Moraxellaceae bacterium]|jgi:uncharacterized protein involved in outer membrane biogenesis|nr:hypothetical protein [Moraxellaceae bacterium]